MFTCDRIKKTDLLGPSGCKSCPISIATATQMTTSLILSLQHEITTQIDAWWYLISFAKKNNNVCSILLEIKKQTQKHLVLFHILFLLARSVHSTEIFIQMVHICSLVSAQPLGKLRSFSPTDNCDCLDSNLPRNASHRWRKREREKGGWIRQDDFSSRPFQTRHIKCFSSRLMCSYWHACGAMLL